MLNDLRYGMRMLLKNPGFTAVAVLTLALGIGANTAIFCLVDTLLMQPPAVRTPEQLVGVYQDRGSDGHFALSSYPDYLYFRDHNTVFSGLALHYSSSPLSLVARGMSREINGAVV